MDGGREVGRDGGAHRRWDPSFYVSVSQVTSARHWIILFLLLGGDFH